MNSKVQKILNQIAEIKINILTFIEAIRIKFWLWQCKRYGCLTTGPYYGMAQSHCRRCGKKTSYAADFCSDYSEPWGKYERKYNKKE